MKKTSKTLWSFVIAVLLVFGAVSMAFSVDACEHIYNEETLVRPEGDINSGIHETGYYICSACNGKVTVKIADYSYFCEAWTKLGSLMDNVYNPYYFTSEAFEEERWEIGTLLFSKIYIEYEQQELDNIGKRVYELCNMFENDLVEKGYTTVIDVYEFYKLEFFATGVSVEALEALEKNVAQNIGLSDEGNAARKSYDEAEKYLNSVRENPETASQEEFDLLAEDYINWSNRVINCLENRHSFTYMKNNNDGTHSLCCDFCLVGSGEKSEHEWGEYLSDNNATVKKDGTKTAECKHCGATDTVLDEGSKRIDDAISFMYELVKLIKMLIVFIVNIFK